MYWVLYNSDMVMFMFMFCVGGWIRVYSTNTNMNGVGEVCILHFRMMGSCICM